MTVPSEVEAFHEVAQRFCAWAEAPPGDSDDDLYWAMRHVADLYAALLAMPGADHDADAPDRFVDKTEHERVYDRFKRLPLQYYGEVFDTTKVPPEEPSLGDLADDLLDIYTDVKAGLLHYAEGHIVQAVWQWQFTWGVHWGRHATSALRAMHCFRTSMGESEV
jgi:hypothetical protein